MTPASAAEAQQVADRLREREYRNEKGPLVNDRDWRRLVVIATLVEVLRLRCQALAVCPKCGHHQA